LKSWEAIDFIRSSILVYNETESLEHAFIVVEEMFGMQKTDVLANRHIANYDEGKVKTIIERINAFEPIQYITGFADFYGRKFIVRKGVLIPRPETEELADLLIKENSAYPSLTILDIGTGSGCIAITLAKEMPFCKLMATDISVEALEIAAENAAWLNADIEFFKLDISNETAFPRKLDIIVSNPPYIEQKEKVQMRENVLEYEPDIALFAPESDPLFFYRKILEFARLNLNPHGKIYFEINERFGTAVKALLEENNFGNIHVINDIHGKNRIVTGERL